jgi:propanediol dehydratase large subunit
MGTPVKAEEVRESFDGLADAIGVLVGQLSSFAPAPTAGQLEEIVQSPACHLLIARDGATIVGTLTLSCFGFQPAFAPGSRTSWSTRLPAVAASGRLSPPPRSRSQETTQLARLI